VIARFNRQVQSPGSIASLTDAGDVAADSLTTIDLQSHINIISKWMKQNRCRPNLGETMTLNPDKALTIPTFSWAGKNAYMQVPGGLFSEKADWYTHQICFAAYE
jgi:hypothetical protein